VICCQSVKNAQKLCHIFELSTYACGQVSIMPKPTNSLVRTAHISVSYDCAQFHDKNSKPITPLTAAMERHQMHAGQFVKLVSVLAAFTELQHKTVDYSTSTYTR